MRRCRTCVLPETKPGLHFDTTGQCSACSNFSNRPSIDWDQRGEQLREILTNAKPGPSGHNVIVPSSGGKDSTWQTLKMIELGARPLVVTAATDYLTPMGFRNIQNLARFATTVQYTPNRTVRAKLIRLGIEIVGDASHPEHMSIFSWPFRAARDFGISLIMFGENPQHEYGGPLGSEQALTMTRRWIGEHGGMLGLRAADFVGMEGITEDDMRDYALPSDADMKDIDALFLGQFLPWDSKANADLAIANGMETGTPSNSSWWSYENLDNAVTGLRDHQMFRKFGYGRMASQISVDIRNGRITREEAIRNVKYHDGAFPYTYAGVHIDEVLRYLDRDMAWLRENLEAHTDHSLFVDTKGDRPILKEFAEEAVA